MSVDHWFVSKRPRQNTTPLLIDGKPVLYKCPYCREGRFTDPVNGFKEATDHIRRVHRRLDSSRPRRKEYHEEENGTDGRPSEIGEDDDS